MKHSHRVIHERASGYGCGRRDWLALSLVAGFAGAAPAWAGAVVHAQATPEQRLVQIYRLIEAEKLWPALTLAQALVRDVPNFRLAHLVHADLLRAMGGALAGPDALAAAALDEESANELAALREEARLRLAAHDHPPAAGLVPQNFVALPASTRHAIAVDASRSRLYFFKHVQGQLELMSHHYVSLGRFGVDKLQEGDARTPLGVYFITSKVAREKLLDFYGTGALPLNYPNAYDRLRGRTGRGIWLHGVPRENYARAPHATDGCVVLANEDFSSLMRTVSPAHTPVVIAQQLEWVKPVALEPTRKLAQQLLGGWQRAQTQPAERASVYMDAQPSGATLPAPRAVKVAYTPEASWAGSHTAAEAHAAQGTTVQDLSVLSYKSHDDLIVMTFYVGRPEPGPLPLSRYLRQYWLRTPQGWKIVFEGSPG